MASSASPGNSRSSRIRPRGRTELHCPFCGRAFFKTDHLHRHERSHTKERPFKCMECDKYFSRNDTLARHLKKLHNVPDAERSSLTVSNDNQSESRGSAGHRDEGYLSQRLIDPSLLVGVNQFAEDTLLEGLDTTSWNPPVPSPDQSWWCEYNFDPNSLDMSLFEPMAFPHAFSPHTSNEEVSHILPHERILPGSDIQKAWFTYIDHHRASDTAQSYTSTTSNDDTYMLDEEFRIRAGQKLKGPLHVDPLPSTGLLNLSVKIYFEDFTSLFPLIHRHTFRPSPENAPLLLVVSALGCLLGGDVAHGHGVRVFERFCTTAMATWGATMHADSEEAISLVKAAILSQVFGLLSGEAKHLSMADNFQGTVIAWARRCDMFRHVNNYPKLDALEQSALEQAWNSWARSEEVLRAVLGLYIIDAQLAGIFHHDPLLRHDSITSTLAADEDVFNAKTAVEWKRRILTRTKGVEVPQLLHSNSYFNSYVVLQNICARIHEEQGRGRLDTASVQYETLHNDLMSWHAVFEQRHRENTAAQVDVFDLTSLWHASFMMLLADFNKLERALGRDGLHNMFLEADLAYAVSWSKSPAADRCVLHALAIQQKLSRMRLCTEPAIHIPHCAFLAGIISYSCLRFRRPAMLVRYPPPFHRGSRSVADFPEFNIHGELERNPNFRDEPVLFDNDRGDLIMRTFTAHCPVVAVGAELNRRCCEVLERMGHFEIARSYAKTLKALVYVEVERWMHG